MSTQFRTAAKYQAEPPEPKFLRPMDVVHMTGLSENTVRRYYAEGKLDAVRVGRNVFITTESVHRLFGGRA